MRRALSLALGLIVRIAEESILSGAGAEQKNPKRAAAPERGNREFELI